VPEKPDVEASEEIPMKRAAMERLIEWKNRTDRRPLILRGARQVGKTWLMKEFGRLQFESVVYVNFEDNPRMQRLFESDLTIPRLLQGISIETGVTVDPERTLLVFDEVQEVPRALTSLKYFQENAPGTAVVAAGSLLGIALHPGTSFPVGKVEFLDLYPLSFLEFLDATGEPGLASVVAAQDWGMADAFHDKLAEILRTYLLVGGMPEAVAAYEASRSPSDARRVHERILESYEQDFSKHAPPLLVPRLRMLWRSLPSQLARENRKFLYDLVKEHARAREYELALNWLVDCGLVHPVHRVTKPSMPLSAYQDLKAFKLFCVDVGLLSTLSRLDPRSVLEGDRVFEEFKGALTEQYVLQEWVAASGRESVKEPYYWSSERSDAEVDFVVQLPNGIVPVEVKAAENLQAKSLRKYRDDFSPTLCVRTSLSRYRKESWLVNLPLYAASAIPRVLDEASDSATKASTQPA
jgi:uncharacterized protein